MNGLISALYKMARALSTVRAFSRAVQTGSPQPVIRRYARKAVGRQYGRALNRVIPPVRPRRRR